MDHGIDAMQCATQAVPVPDIADEVAQRRVLLRGKLLRHLELFEFVAAENNQTFDIRIVIQHVSDESFAKATGAAGNEDGFVVEHGRPSWLVIFGMNQIEMSLDVQLSGATTLQFINCVTMGDGRQTMGNDKYGLAVV